MVGQRGTPNSLRRIGEWAHTRRMNAPLRVEPSDELCLAIGRMTWANLNLHHTVRFLYEHAGNQERPYRGGTLGRLLDEVKKVLPEDRVEEYDRWLVAHGDQARVARNAVVHGIPGFHWGEGPREPVISTMTSHEVQTMTSEIEKAHIELTRLVRDLGRVDQVVSLPAG